MQLVWLYFFLLITWQIQHSNFFSPPLNVFLIDKLENKQANSPFLPVPQMQFPLLMGTAGEASSQAGPRQLSATGSALPGCPFPTLYLPAPCPCSTVPSMTPSPPALPGGACAHRAPAHRGTETSSRKRTG